MDEGPIRIGAALNTLLDAPVDDVALACASPNDGMDLPASTALAAISSYISIDESRCARVIALILDHSSTRRRHKRAGLLLRHLLAHELFSANATTAVVDCLAGDSSFNPAKLALVASLQAVTAAPTTGSLVWSPSVLSRLLQATAACTYTAPEPTKLAAAAVDATICGFAEACKCAQCDDAAFATWRKAMQQCTTDMCAVLNVLSRWRHTQVAFVAAMDELSYALQQLDGEGGDFVAMARLWQHCAPILLCAAEAPNRSKLRARFERWSARLAPPGDDDYATRREVLCGFAVQIDSLDSGMRTLALTLAAPTIHPLVCSLIRASNQQDSALPLALLRALVPSMMRRDGGELAIWIGPLLDMLHATDVAAPLVVQRAAQLAGEYPEVVLPDVCAKLASRVPTQRANAIAILRAVGERQQLTRLLGRSHSEGLCESLIALLPEEPVALLPEEPVAILPEEPVASLLAMLDVHIALPCLAAAATTSCSGSRAVVLDAPVLAALTSTREPASALGAIVDTLRDIAARRARTDGQRTMGSSGSLPSSPPRHPGDIGPPSPTGEERRSFVPPAAAADGSADDAGAAMLLRAVHAWACSLSSGAWEAVLRMACTKFFAAAQDTWSMRVLKALLAAGGDGGGDSGGDSGGDGDGDGDGDGGAARHAIVIGAAIHRLSSLQPSADDASVTTDATATAGVTNPDDMSAGSARRDAHEPFDKLRPLLLLQMLPEAMWRLVTDVTDGTGEIDPIEHGGAGEGAQPAGVSALRALLPACRAALTACVDDEGEMQQVRKLAASLLARLPPGKSAQVMWARVRRAADEPLGYGAQPASALALYYVCCAVSLHPVVAESAAGEAHATMLLSILTSTVRSEPFQRLQQGAMDCLGRVLTAPYLTAPHVAPRGGGSSSLDERLLSMLDAPVTSGLPIVLLGVSIRMMHSHGGGSAVAPLANAWIPTLLARDGAAITNALFEIAYHMQANPPGRGMRQHATALLERARHDARDAHAPTRLAALKLLGVLLSSLPTTAEGDEPLEVLRMLHELARDDSAEEVRTLAQALVRTAVGTVGS